MLIQQLYTFRVNGSGMQLYATGSVRKGQYRYKISPITVKRCSNKIGYYLNFFGRLHFHLYERKTCWCLCSLAFPYPLLFDWQRKCHHTPQNKVDLKYLLSPHNLIAVYSCIKGTTLSFHREADNEINEYLIDAGDLNHLVYQLTFRQGLSNHFVNPRLDSEQSQKGMIQVLPIKY